MAVVLIKSSKVGAKPYGKFMKNMVSIITNVFKLMEGNILFHKLSLCL